MPAESNLSPERQLLKIIEKPAGAPPPPGRIKYQGAFALPGNALILGVAALSAKLRGFFLPAGARQFDLKTLNAALKVVLGGLALYLVFVLVDSAMLLNRDLSVKLGDDQPAGQRQESSVTLLKAASYYLEKARSRDIFNMGSRTVNFERAGQLKLPSQKIVEATQHLRLVGIAWSDDPDVMIEDTKSNRTYFLKKGQIMENEIRLQAVFKDKVTLAYGGEEIELR